MKKTYTKPVLYAESFRLVEHISSCAMVSQALHNTAYTCAYDDGAGTIMFLDNNSACTGQQFPADQGDLDELVQAVTNNGFCYNTVVSGQLFSS